MLTQKTIIQNVGWNLLGQIIPLFIALFCVPVMIANLGTERFGVFTLIASSLIYFNLFELGITLSLVHFLANKSYSQKGINDCGVLGGLVCFGKEVIFSTYSYWPYAVFYGIVINFERPVF